MIEIYVLLCQSFPSLAQKEVTSFLIPNGKADTANLRVNPTFIMGLALNVFGTALRLECYRRLGPNFSYDLTIRTGHTLCTEGPYAIVRHPCYTGILAYVVGYSLCHFGPGSWWVECGILDTTAGKVIGCLFFLWTVGVTSKIFKRCKIEDGVLKQVFGKQWMEWVQRTPYAILPYVY